MISGIVTGILLAAFVGGWIWVWRPSRTAQLEAAARMPLIEDASEELS